MSNSKNIILLILSLILFRPTSVPASSFWSTDSMAKVSDEIINDLSTKIILGGKTIQISENNFWERETLLNLPFSKILRDALAAELSNKGVIVTVREVGEEPLKLVGTYGFEGRDLIVTARIRHMGEKAGKDIAVSRASISKGSLEDEWFRPDFRRVANTLVRMLEENYSGTMVMDVDIEPLRSGIRGEPSILLGSEMKKYLSTAIKSSVIFGEPYMGAKFPPFKMQGTYTKSGNYMRIYVEVIGPEGRQMTSASFNVKLSDIPQALFKIGTGEDIIICLEYAPGSHTDLKADSPAVKILLDHISGVLGENGFEGRICGPENNNLMKIITRMNMRTRNSPDGYDIAFGDLWINLISADGNNMGALVYNGKSVLQDDIDKAGEKIVEAIFEKEDIADRLRLMILSH